MATGRDITNQAFGHLIAREFAGHYQGARIWRCDCTRCGASTTATVYALTSGGKTSCGCLRRDMLSARRKTHGKSGTDIHRIWTKMTWRCRDPGCPSYKNYGARGIDVCPEWAASFEAFSRDMGPRPSKQHSVDRIDNDGPYAPGNCRWATRKEQAQNRRGVLQVNLGGEVVTLAEAARRHGVSGDLAWERRKRGLPQSEWFKPAMLTGSRRKKT